MLKKKEKKKGIQGLPQIHPIPPNWVRPQQEAVQAWEVEVLLWARAYIKFLTNWDIKPWVMVNLNLLCIKPGFLKGGKMVLG